MTEENREWQEQVKEIAIDVRNEAIMQGASLYLLARRVLALSMEEAQAFVDKLVERGEIAEVDAQRLLQDFRERAKKQEAQIQKAGEEGAKQAENVVESQITAVLNRMNVPTKRDIDQLSRQIELLNAKIDSLRGRGMDNA